MRYLNLHILHTVAYSNLNRDDTGSPKSLVYGSVPRARWSSQSINRRQRVAFEAESVADMSARSKVFAKTADEGSFATKIAREVAERLAERGTDLGDEQQTELADQIAKQLSKLTTGKDEGKRATLIWLAEAERDRAATRVVDKYLADRQLDGVELAEVVGRTTGSLSIAARGRFFAGEGPTMDAAVQVAHAFTTHEKPAELDYFTAVNDLSASFGDSTGAGHLNVAQYTTGTFYRYANVNRDQLRANWDDIDRDDARQRLEAFYRIMISVLPDGKAAATAPHTLPSLVLAQASHQPLSYAPAFERPVPASDDGYEQASVDRLLDYARRVRTLDPDGFTEPELLSVFDVEASRTIGELASFCADWTLDAAR